MIDPVAALLSQLRLETESEVGTLKTEPAEPGKNLVFHRRSRTLGQASIYGVGRAEVQERDRRALAAAGVEAVVLEARADRAGEDADVVRVGIGRRLPVLGLRGARASYRRLRREGLAGRRRGAEAARQDRRDRQDLLGDQAGLRSITST